jgi:hypothetical protein
MSIVVNGSGTITGISTGGLPDGSVDVDTLAANSVTAAKIVDGTIVDAEVTSLAASKLTGALPAISAANLTSIPAGNLTGTVADARISALTSSKLTGALPALSAANLTSIPAANITGTLPAISGANLTGLVTGQPIFRAYLSSDQSHGGGNVKILFNTQDYIVGSGVTFGSNKFTFTKAGKYFINYNFRISSSLSNGEYISPKIKHNTAEIGLKEVRVGAAGSMAMGGSVILNIVANDIVYLNVYNGNSCTIKNGTGTTFLEGFRIG